MSNHPYRILIADDEFIIAEDIKEKLNGFGYNVVDTVGTGREAISTSKRKTPDLVLMDINLQGRMDGIEAASEIWGRYDIPVVFLTSFSDVNTLQRAKMAEPFGYVVKPFHDSNLRSTIEIALHKSMQEESKSKSGTDAQTTDQPALKSDKQIFVRQNSVIQKILTKDICSIHALKDYMMIKTKKKNYYAHTTMKDLQAKLPPEDFVRVHRSYVVSLDKIDTIEENTLSVAGELIPIGRAYKVGLMKCLNMI